MYHEAIRAKEAIFMGKYKKILAVFLSLAMAAGTFGCAGKPGNMDAPQEGSGAQANAGESGSQGDQEKKSFGKYFYGMH